MLPSPKHIQTLCDNKLYKSAPLQILALSASLTFILTLVLNIPVILAAPLALITGQPFWHETESESSTFFAWLSVTVSNGAFLAALISITIHIITTTLRGRFGDSHYELNLEMELPPKEAFIRVYEELRYYRLVKKIEKDENRLCLVALKSQGKYLSTYLAVQVKPSSDADHSVVILSAASEPQDKYIWLSSLFCDFGESIALVNRLKLILHPVLSCKTRKGKKKHTDSASRATVVSESLLASNLQTSTTIASPKKPSKMWDPQMPLPVEHLNPPPVML